MINKLKSKLNINKKADLILGGVLLLALILGVVAYFFLTREKPFEEKNVELKEPETKVQIVDVNSKTRPYAVMINNIAAARSLQSGLQDAYIIYEMVVEGGLTRYLALFMDTNTERIGSIRSARHYYLDYTLENDAIYVHHGQSPQAQSEFSSLGIDRVIVDSSKTGWRDKKLKVSSEHTLFTSTDKLAKGLGSKRTERNNDLLLSYSADELDLSQVEGAVLANNVIIKYSNAMKSSYTYDSETKNYKRFVNDKEHKDYVTEKQYTFKNIITYQVKNSTISGDTSGRQDLKNVGSGTGYYISNGYAISIKWNKPSRKEQTVYTYENGEKINVNDGNTFIQIQPEGEELIFN